MPRRLTRIVTRTGDTGTTGLADGSRVPKDGPRVEAMGTVDELNSIIGLLRASELPQDMDGQLAEIQQRLFDLGGGLALPGSDPVTESHVAELERLCQACNDNLPPLKEFVLPGGGQAAATCHLARACCRRAERALWALHRVEAAPQAALMWLNRLSDLLFVYARVLARAGGVDEVLWQRRDDNGA